MAKSQLIIGVKGDVNLDDLNKGIAKLQAMKAEAGGTSQQFTRFGDSLIKLGAVIAATFTVTKVVDFFQDSMKAAIEDEKSMVALAKAMENVGLAQKTAAAEDLIKSMSLQFGIADDKLRPAFQRLVTATRDVDQSQRLLKTALDISAAGYADTESAAKALSAAAMGNFTALQRLKLPIDANTVAAKDFDGAIAQLNQTVGGQAAAAAETYQGKLNRLTVAANEAKETIGYALLDSIDGVSRAMGGVGGATSAISDFGTEAGQVIRGLGVLAEKLASLTPPADRSAESVKRLADRYNSFWEAMLGEGNFEGGFRYLGDTADKAKEEINKLAVADNRLARQHIYLAATAAGATTGLDNLADSSEGAADSANYASRSYLAMATSIANAAYSAAAFKRDMANTSGTVQSAITEGAKLGGIPGYFEAIRKRAAEADKALRGSGGGGSGGAAKQTEEVIKLDTAMRRTLQTVNETATRTGALNRTFGEIGGDAIASFSRKMLAAGQITADTKDQFESMVGTIRDRFNTALSEAKDRLKQAEQAYKDLQDSFANGIRQGNGIADAASAQADAVQALADAQKAYDAALAGGNADEINKTSTALAKAKDKQGTFLSFLQMGVDSAEAFSDQIQQLIKANTSLDVVSQIVQMGAKTGSRVAAELLAGGAEAINQANIMVAKVGRAAEAAGLLAAQTFRAAGVLSAQSYVEALESAVQPLLQSLLNSIAAQIAAALKQPVNANLGGGGGGGGGSSPTSASVAAMIPTAGDGSPARISAINQMTQTSTGNWFGGIRLFADGGLVMAPTLGIVGESGPEAVIPLNRMGQVTSGGNTYQITVQAGVGDPRQIGEQIVTYIKRFEQSSGQVFASA